MAIPAVGRARGAHRVADAMDAGRIQFGFVRMAVGTIGRRKLAVVDQFLDAVVAIDAVKFRMDGILERLGRKQEGYILPVHLARRAWVQMTIQAIAVLECRCAAGGQTGAQEQKENQAIWR